VSPRPAIFISAVSKELQSARQLVSNTLTFLGYEPEWQDIFSTEEGDLREMLRRRIERCKAVVQLVGQSYGAEPPTPDEQFGRVSYAQYEALYARQVKKKVWYLILNEDFTTDPHDREPQELHDLQNAYRGRLKSENLVRHSLGSREALEASVLKLRDELTRLRRGAKQWAVGVVVLLALCVGLGLWVLQRQSALDAKLDRILGQTTLKFPEEESKIRREQPNQSAAEIDQRTYEALAKQLGVDARVLEQKLPQFARQLRKDPNATTYERASAAYVAKDYNEAERLALAAADEAKKSSKTSNAIKALELAGNAADARIEYARARQHFRAAEQLTDRARDPLEWAGQQWNIAKVLDEQGRYAEAEATYRIALAEYQRARGEEDQDVLSLRNNLASTLRTQGKFAEAEIQHREVIELKAKLLGPEHPSTLLSRNNLANALYGQGKYAEAEAQYREVIKLKAKVLGLEHLSILNSRNNLANALADQGKHAEAETQYREVLKLREKVLGPEHPDTLLSRTNLANALDDKGEHAEAELQYREVIKLQEKVLGPEHPDTLQSRNNLAAALCTQSKYAEGETQFREVTKLKERVLGPDHPDTLAGAFNLALCLKLEMKMDEAREFARRAAEGAGKVLGANHPDTLRYRKLWQELQKN
jgi:tetratricopeptide (TPR) repeat protein